MNLLTFLIIILIAQILIIICGFGWYYRKEIQAFIWADEWQWYDIATKEKTNIECLVKKVKYPESKSHFNLGFIFRNGFYFYNPAIAILKGRNMKNYYNEGNSEPINPYTRKYDLPAEIKKQYSDTNVVNWFHDKGIEDWIVYAVMGGLLGLIVGYLIDSYMKKDYINPASLNITKAGVSILFFNIKGWFKNVRFR